MNTRQMRYFLGVLDARSFTRASEVLNVAQPAIGMQIRKLEDELGVQLLVRHSRGVRPTDAGEFLARHSVVILAEVERVRQTIMAMRHQRPRPLNEIASQPWIPDASRSPEL